MINLLLAPKNEPLRIVKIKGNKVLDKALLQRLQDMGFLNDASISVISQAGGNIIVKVKDAKLAIGKEIAKSIYVV